MIFGVLVSFLTTQTEHARHSEPLLIYSSAYMAFVVAELFHWFVYIHIWCIGIVLMFSFRSGIISIIGYGLGVKRLKLR